MTDRLAALLGHFAVSARTFQSGPLCGINSLEGNDPFGQLHLVQQGEVEVWHGNKKAFHIQQPSLLLYPRSTPHRFVTDAQRGADFLCAHIAFEGGSANPIVNALPVCVNIPLAQLPDCKPMLSLLFAEAIAHNCGRQAMLDRLFEVVLIQLLRHLIEDGSAQVGMLAGLTHPQLRRALVAIHEAPERSWTVESLATVAGMSRSVFSNQFHETVGEPPATYLQRWRVGLVQKWITQGRPLKLIAEEAGYGSESALSRAFKAQCGLSPREWLKRGQ
jgi:AraC family transcriptional regulator, alkane utilization regulator